VKQNLERFSATLSLELRRTIVIDGRERQSSEASRALELLPTAWKFSDKQLIEPGEKRCEITNLKLALEGNDL
jgi:hypothetical protein